MDKEELLPFDQHFLVAAIAPRKVYVSSSVEDEWARLPEVGEYYHEGNIGYHLRKGTHWMGREDWNLFIDFIGND